MNLKTYQAYTIAEALAAVKRDLGAGAVILNTRTFKRGGLLGLGRRTIVEVSATKRDATRGKAKPVKAGAGGGASAARTAYAQAAGARPGNEERGTSQVKKPAPARVVDPQRRRELARAMMEARRRADHAEPAESKGPAQAQAEAAAPTSTAPSEPASAPKDIATAGASVAAASVSTAPSATGAQAQEPLLRAARRFVLRPPDDKGAPAGEASRATAAVPAMSDAPAAPSAPASRRPNLARLYEERPRAVAEPGAGGGDDELHAMQEELASIRQMVARVLQRQVTSKGTPAPTMPQKLFDMYLKLVSQDLSEELADQIINHVRDELSPGELEDETALRSAVIRHLADYIPVAEQPVPRESPDTRPLTIALIGPTGVGKTTTLAKLAAAFKLRYHRKVGLITSDTYRIAAVDQLRTYAEIIGLPLKVALTPAEMQQATHALGDCDVLLIDTAGRSQHDARRIEELKRFVAAASPHEVHLVLSGTAGERVLMREAEAFSEIGVDKVALTKLDEAVSFGVLVNAVRKIGKELSFFTTGQEVPDHIERGRAERLAELVLGDEVHE